MPPLRYICYKYRVFNVSIHVLCSEKYEIVVRYRRGGNLPPATWQIQPVRVKGTTQNTVQKLPHWGSWQGAALTDEVSGATCNILETVGESGETPPCLSLWERWPSAARTERVYVEDTLDVLIQKTPQGPLSLGYAEPALPEGEARGVPLFGSYRSPPQVIHPTWRAAGCRWNYGVIAPGNQKILIRCAEHHPYVKFVTYYRIFDAFITVLCSQNTSF